MYIGNILQSLKGGGNEEKNFLKDLYRCNDGRMRKVFTIKGHGNTRFVMYKGRVIKKSDVPGPKK